MDSWSYEIGDHVACRDSFRERYLKDSVQISLKLVCQLATSILLQSASISTQLLDRPIDSGPCPRVELESLRVVIRAENTDSVVHVDLMKLPLSNEKPSQTI